MVRFGVWLIIGLAFFPATGFCCQSFSPASEWTGEVFESSSASSLQEFSGNCQSGNCGSGKQGCSEPPCSGPLYQRKYVSVFGGYADVDNFERTLSDSTLKYVDGLNLRDGGAGGMAIGGQMIEHVRSEFEVTYRENDFTGFLEQDFNLSSGLLVDSDFTAAGGTLRTWSGMFNLLFDTCPRCPNSPSLYLGGGLGGLYADGEATTATSTFVVQNASFAYQFIGGINYPIRERIDLYTEYRYLGANGLNVSTASANYGDFNFDSHNVFFGLRLWR